MGKIGPLASKVCFADVEDQESQEFDTIQISANSHIATTRNNVILQLKQRIKGKCVNFLRAHYPRI